MPDVSCRVFEFFTVNADTYGYGLDDLVRGAESPLEVFLDTSERVSWNDWAQISDNFCRLVGGLHETRIAGRTVPEMQFSAPMRSLGAALLTPADLYATTTRWLGPYLFRSLAWEVESLSPTHVVIRIAVRPGDRVSTAWFHLAQGAFEALPTVVGLSMAACQMDIDGGEVAFDLRCEAGQTWLSQLRSRARLATQPGVLLDQLADLQSDLRDAYARSVAAQEELRRALSAVPDPVAIVHADSPVWTNASWDRLIGETWPIPVTTTPGEHGSGDSRQIELPGSPPRVLEMPPPATIRYEGRSASLLLLRDVTDTRRAMVGRRVADRLAALGTLAASVGHEINNPLAYSMATLEQLQQKLASPEPPTAESLRSHVEQALDGLARVAEITRDLMAIARDSATAEDFDLVEVLRSAARLAGNELRHAADLHLDLPETLPAVHGHASRITQVIVNLLVNATQAMAEIDRRDHEVRVHAAAEGAGVRITLSDTGPGIAPELIDRIREPFFTTKGVGGSGLGLAVCDSIIEEHGGELDIESELGVGTTVRLWLPISTRTPTPAPVRDSGPATGLRRVLVVDDEAPLARLLAKVLRPAEVVVHTTGADALGHIAHDARFDAVLLDVMMSDTTGLDVYEDLPDTLKPRVVFITGGVFQPKIRDALDRLPNPILSKPFSRSQLLDAVDQVAP